jgi:tRNA (adenine22-N1)-methyltransferase
MINIRGRLLTIASIVGRCKKPADVGTDHAYIPIYLVQSGKCDYAIATDIKKGPLKKAAKNIEKYKLSDRIELRLGNGIEPIQKGECDAFIISGIGGVVITEIIKTSVDVLKEANTIILQPTYYDEVLREYLLNSGFCIETESLVRDEGRLYSVIKAKYDGVVRSDDDLYYYIGRALFEEKDPLLNDFLKRRIDIQTRIVHGIEKSIQRDEKAYLKECNLLRKMKDSYTQFL